MLVLIEGIRPDMTRHYMSVSSPERHGVSNQRQFDCLLNNSLMLGTIRSKLSIFCLLWTESISISTSWDHHGNNYWWLFTYYHFQYAWWRHKWKHSQRYSLFAMGIHRSPLIWDTIALIMTSLKWDSSNRVLRCSLLHVIVRIKT